MLSPLCGIPLPRGRWRQSPGAREGRAAEPTPTWKALEEQKNRRCHQGYTIKSALNIHQDREKEVPEGLLDIS